MYVIVRNEDRAFVRPPGCASSYTTDLLKARQFITEEAAQRECCGNEHPVHIASLLDRSANQ